MQRYLIKETTISAILVKWKSLSKLYTTCNATLDQNSELPRIHNYHTLSHHKNLLYMNYEVVFVTWVNIATGYVSTNALF